MKKKFGDYYLGLDIGTDSVGWAVTSPEYDILKFNGKAMWGIRLFNPGETAEKRRTFRTARRRTARAHQRLMLLQELFAEEVAKKDPEFFLRLKESKFVSTDKIEHQSNTLFNDDDYNDQKYHEDYATIYHLREAFIDGNDINDIRLLYLAVSHIIKNRGHFLFPEEDLNTATDFKTAFAAFNSALEDEFEFSFSDVDADEVSKYLKAKVSSKTKIAELKKHINIGDSTPKNEIVALLSGKDATLSNLFESLKNELEEADINKLSLSTYDDETYDKLSNILQDKIVVIDCAKALYDWALLDEMRDGNLYISKAKVGLYEKHREDLELLKSVVKRYNPYDPKKPAGKDNPNLRNRIFRSSKIEGNYAAYVKNTIYGSKTHALKNCTQATFCDFIAKELKPFTNPKDKELCAILEKAKNRTLLPKQRTSENSVVPYQLNLLELRTILKNAEKNFAFLSKKDESGLTVSEKIIKLLTFRIPYYVGPLNDAHKESGNCWIVKRDEASKEKITPWNFDEIVDREKCQEAFIDNLTNNCTYLTTEKVIPKQSILYSKYMVLNDLNNIRVNGEALSVDLKQKVFNELFLTQKRVKMKNFMHFLITNAGFDKDSDNIIGIDGDFKSSMASYIDFRNLLGDDFNVAFAEDAIKQVVLFHNEPEALKSRLSQIGKGYFTDEQIRKITRMNFSGWGRFSRAFLKEIPDVNPTTGECNYLSIMDALWNTQENLNQLLSSSHYFKRAVDARDAESHGETVFTYDCLVKDLYASPKVKRGIWQALLIVKEIEKITGHPPKKIFLEVAREDGEKERSIKRKDKLDELYRNCEKEADDFFKDVTNLRKKLSEESDAKLRAKKLYLYYTQLGRCMYSGREISLANLMDKNLYDIDHIFPRSRTKDDSLDNLVLVERQLNKDKGNNYPVPQSYREKMHNDWRKLLAKGFISKKKFDRLTRVTPFSDEELAGFIARQLVETRQSTKAVAGALSRLYPNSDLVYVKAGVVSDFKNADEHKLLKCREINDLHHAKDAYINIVAGNVFDVKFTKSPINYIKNKNSEPYSLHRIFEHDVIRNGVTAWIAGPHGTIEKVKKTYEKNNILFTRYAYEKTGQLFEVNPKKGKDDYLPLKKDSRLSNTKQYGGYDGISVAYFCLVEHTKGNERNRTIEAIPLYLSEKIKQVPSALDEYLYTNRKLCNPRVLIPKIKIDTLFCVDGFYMHLSSNDDDRRISMKNAMQLFLDSNSYAYAKKIINYNNYISKTQSNILPAEFDDNISTDSNIRLLNVLIEKMLTTYKVRFADIGNEISKEKFETLSLPEQCKILQAMFGIFKHNGTRVDLNSINSRKSAERIRLNKNISTKKITTISIINDSPTGLFRQIIDLKSL